MPHPNEVQSPENRFQELLEGKDPTLRRLLDKAYRETVDHIHTQGRSDLTIRATLNERPWIFEYEAEIIVDAALVAGRGER